MGPFLIRSVYWSGCGSRIPYFCATGLVVVLRMRKSMCCCDRRGLLNAPLSELVTSSSTSSVSCSARSSGIEIGDKFSSFEDLKSRIATYEKEKSVQLLQRDSRTLEAARKRVPRKVEKANNSLVYYSITFCCAFGGKDYKCKSNRKRVHQRLVSDLATVVTVNVYNFSTLKQGCKASIKVGLSDDCQHLVILDVNENHNHDISKVHLMSLQYLL